MAEGVVGGPGVTVIKNVGFESDWGEVEGFLGGVSWLRACFSGFLF